MASWLFLYTSPRSFTAGWWSYIENWWSRRLPVITASWWSLQSTDDHSSPAKERTNWWSQIPAASDRSPPADARSTHQRVITWWSRQASWRSSQLLLSPLMMTHCQLISMVVPQWGQVLSLYDMFSSIWITTQFQLLKVSCLSHSREGENWPFQKYKAVRRGDC